MAAKKAEPQLEPAQAADPGEPDAPPPPPTPVYLETTLAAHGDTERTETHVALHFFEAATGKLLGSFHELAGLAHDDVDQFAKDLCARLNWGLEKREVPKV